MVGRWDMLGRGLMVLGILVSSAGAANAAATLSCVADDKVLDFSAMAVVGHIHHNPILQFQGEIRLRLKEVPEDRRVIRLADEHLTHRWLYGSDLKLLIFQEQPGGPFPWIELVVQTQRAAGDDASSRGTYRLTLPLPDPRKSSEEREFTARGRVTCSIG
jgi:hypothetical protein